MNLFALWTNFHQNSLNGGACSPKLMKIKSWHCWINILTFLELYLWVERTFFCLNTMKGKSKVTSKSRIFGYMAFLDENWSDNTKIMFLSQVWHVFSIENHILYIYFVFEMEKMDKNSKYNVKIMIHSYGCN